uniref:SFRICE_032404 n=1 Tax=Spodoptera frugiperda TaxID=7108 RepID=A0A2H1W6M5_SPOFR
MSILGRGFDPFDPRLLSIKLDVVLSLNGLEISTLSHCIYPCFEPRSTIRPSLLDSKPGKEEKKNLIANMEYPDDPY